jgi:2-oxoglutarate ferredoxin oxidoreductase subunit alpha
VDSYYNCPSLDIADDKINAHIVKTKKDYKRYTLTKKGISPRGIPGYGNGLVMVDSDEHDEFGRITEDMQVREKMVQKRLTKAEEIAKDVIEPDLIGPETYKTLIIGWGSTYHVIKEAMALWGKKDCAFLHFKQVFPLYSKTASYLKKAKRTIIIENNATSQFGRIIKLQTGLEIDHAILKYNGIAFSVEELVRELDRIMN